MTDSLAVTIQGDAYVFDLILEGHPCPRSAATQVLDVRLPYGKLAGLPRTTLTNLEVISKWLYHNAFAQSNSGFQTSAVV
jgi:hypothetical protein